MRQLILIACFLSICFAYGDDIPLSSTTEDQFSNNIKLFDTAIENEDFSKAREILKFCSVLAVDNDDLIEILKQKEQHFIQTGNKKLDEISALKDSVDKGWKLYVFAKKFKGMPVAKKALEKYAVLRNNKKFRKALMKKEKEQWVERQFTYAINAKNDEKYWIAFQTFKRIVANFPDAQESVKASYEMTQMQKDEKVMTEIQKRENEVITEMMFRLAQTYESYNKIDEAKEVYNKIIKKHPNTVYASRAELKLKELEKALSDKSN